MVVGVLELEYGQDRSPVHHQETRRHTQTHTNTCQYLTQSITIQSKNNNTSKYTTIRPCSEVQKASCVLRYKGDWFGCFHQLEQNHVSSACCCLFTAWLLLSIAGLRLHREIRHALWWQGERGFRTNQNKTAVFSLRREVRCHKKHRF